MSTRILIVDTRPERGELLAPTLMAEGFHVVACVSPDQDLLTAVTTYRPEVVLIDIDSPDRDTLENLRTVQAHQPSPMVLFTQDDNGDSIRDAIRAGVTAYVVDGLEHRRVRPIVEAAMARFVQFRALEEELKRIRTKLEDRKVRRFHGQRRPSHSAEPARFDVTPFFVFDPFNHALYGRYARSR